MFLRQLQILYAGKSCLANPTPSQCIALITVVCMLFDQLSVPVITFISTLPFHMCERLFRTVSEFAAAWTTSIPTPSFVRGRQSRLENLSSHRLLLSQVLCSQVTGKNICPCSAMKVLKRLHFLQISLLHKQVGELWRSCCRRTWPFLACLPSGRRRSA